MIFNSDLLLHMLKQIERVLDVTFQIQCFDVCKQSLTIQCSTIFWVCLGSFWIHLSYWTHQRTMYSRFKRPSFWHMNVCLYARPQWQRNLETKAALISRVIECALISHVIGLPGFFKFSTQTTVCVCVYVCVCVCTSLGDYSSKLGALLHAVYWVGTCHAPQLSGWSKKT